MVNVWIKEYLIYLRHLVVAFGCLIVFVSCGELQANRHPDSLLMDNDSFNSFDEYGTFLGTQGTDARFRKARVTTASTPLRLKVEPDSRASSPSSGPRRLDKGETVNVYCPMEINNKDGKLYVQRRTLYGTQKSSGVR